jgi:hypothetical protein
VKVHQKIKEEEERQTENQGRTLKLTNEIEMKQTLTQHNTQRTVLVKISANTRQRCVR